MKSANGFLLQEALLAFFILILAVTLLVTGISTLKNTQGLLIDETITS